MAWLGLAAGCATAQIAAEDATRRATGREVTERVDRTIDRTADEVEEVVLDDDDAAPSQSDADVVDGTVGPETPPAPLVERDSYLI